MKNFFKYILVRIGVFFLVIYLLDVVYSTIYNENSCVRNKIKFVFNSEVKDYDYIFLGSSRVEFHVDTELIEDITNKKSLNLGVSGQNLPETFLFFKLLLEQGFRAEKYFIQVDISDLKKVKNSSFIGASYFMPYITNKNIADHIKRYDEDYFLDYNLPFYRYINYGYTIGYRELLLNIFGKERKEKFFIGLKSNLQNKEATTVFNENYDNSLLNEINDFAKLKGIKVLFFSSPYYNPVNSEPYEEFCLKNGIKSYVDSIPDIQYFKDADHLNNNGATKLTKLLIREFKLK